MKKIHRPYLDFYKKHKVSPVLSKVNLKVHSNQRTFLYTKLGINSGYIKNKNILEFGPGNGLNAVITNFYGPKKYSIVDANLIGIKNCKKNFLKYFKKKNWNIINSNIYDFSEKRKYDLVISECLIPQQNNPKKMANHCGSFTSKEGIYVLTCHDHVSTLSETLKCLPAWILACKINDFRKQTIFLSKIFKKQLSFLKGMTRSTEDWVVDNVINTEYWQDAPLFGIDEAINTLKKNFYVYKTLPNFSNGWRWYKSIKSFKKTENDFTKENYLSNVHNLIDWRVVGLPQPKKNNNLLISKCKSVRTNIKKYFVNFEDKFLIKIIYDCEDIKKYLPKSHNITKKSINDVILLLKYFLKYKKIKIKYFNNLAPWWGRGLQYISFIKK